MKRYLEDCDYVFESCGVKDERTQGLLFVLACQYRQFGFLQVLQKYVLDESMYETCGSWSKTKNALLKFSKAIADGNSKYLGEYAYLWEKKDDQFGIKCSREEVLKLVNLNLKCEYDLLGKPFVDYAL